MIRFSTAATVLLVLGLFHQGCYVTSSSVEVGEDLVPAKVEAIVPSVTTRTQVLDLFGPPLAALRPGDEAVVEGHGGREETLRYEEQFLLFTDAHPPSEKWAIYYYQQLGGSSEGVLMVVYSSGSSSSERKRLWVLVDETTGIVAAHVFRED